MPVKRSTSVLILSQTSTETPLPSAKEDIIVTPILVHPLDFLDLVTPTTLAQTLALNQAPITLALPSMNSTTSITMEKLTLVLKRTDINSIHFILRPVLTLDMVAMAVVELLLEQMVPLTVDTMDTLMLQASETGTMMKFTTMTTSAKHHSTTILFIQIAAPPAVRALRAFLPTLTQISSTLTTPLNHTILTQKKILAIQLSTKKDQPALELT